MKGLSFNVTLSDTQMEEIAAFTADKVLKTRTYDQNTEERLNSKIEDLKRTVSSREKMIIEREIIISRYKTVIVDYKNTIKKYEEKYGKLTE